MKVGCDVISIARIEKLLKEQKDTFLNRVCVEGERDLLKKFSNKKRLAEKLAGIFSLKEAFSKAVGTGVGESLSFQQLEVSYSELGQPQMKYLGSLHSFLDSQIACSVSHEGDLLFSVVIISD